MTHGCNLRWWPFVVFVAMISFSRHLTSQQHVNNLEFVSGCRDSNILRKRKPTKSKKFKHIVLSTLSSILTGAPSVPAGPEGPKMPREP